MKQLTRLFIAGTLSVIASSNLYASMASCLQAHPVNIPAHRIAIGGVIMDLPASSIVCDFASASTDNCVNTQGCISIKNACIPTIYNCIDSEIQTAAQNANAQITDLKNLHNVDTSHIVDRFNQDEAIINNNHNNVLAQIQATNNSIATTVTNTVNQQLLAQVSQNLPQVVQSQLTPELIAKGLQSQYQMALNTKFKKNSGALYIRGFMTKVNENGGQELQVYAVDPDTNFCNSTDGFKSPAQATLYMGQKNATTIAAYLFSAYATGKPVVLETQGGKDGSGNPYCSIVNIKQDVDVNTLKA
ncbi:hypothetical protein [Cysteiniphilum sp. QT6929]|uniref:hypothetical protein n=1 Tax=Cysteiniphilum sp. QT6929 TaxID=2975055 RepID=UPI0024B3541E|nr:hypothetical protein [Cysteiniphilum sp. QT6929]WHN66083.1 hypothetical protein NYP54_02310 [Cysteiniphilum sp. QT6929]